MAWMPYSEEHRPVFHFRGHPVFATVFLIVLHSASTIALSLLQGFHHPEWIKALSFFNSDVFHRYHLWKLFTYPLVHFPDLNFLWGMIILFQFGKTLEQYLGRNSFLFFYISLAILPALILTIATPWISVSLNGALYLHFALMVACATIEPNDEIFFFRAGLQLKWLTLIVFALFALSAIAANDWPGMVSLIVSCSLAYQGARWFVEGTHPVQELVEKLRNKTTPPALNAPEETAVDESIDSILEKISKSGIKSLSSSERDALEKARLELLKKEQKT